MVANNITCRVSEEWKRKTYHLRAKLQLHFHELQHLLEQKIWAPTITVVTHTVVASLETHKTTIIENQKSFQKCIHGGQITANNSWQQKTKKPYPLDTSRLFTMKCKMKIVLGSPSLYYALNSFSFCFEIYMLFHRIYFLFESISICVVEGVFA